MLPIAHSGAPAHFDRADPRCYYLIFNELNIGSRLVQHPLINYRHFTKLDYMEFIAAIFEVLINRFVFIFFPKEDWETNEEIRAKVSGKDKGSAKQKDSGNQEI